MTDYKKWKAYEYTSAHYGDRKAERSQAPLIRHIDMGVEIMHRMGCTDADAVASYILHPLFQTEHDLHSVGMPLVRSRGIPPLHVLYIMEYRYRANAWLSNQVSEFEGVLRMTGMPSYGGMGAVYQMLVGDKVQNYYDFLRYHKDTHSRSKALTFYFDTWLDVLGIDQNEFARLTEGLENV